MTLIFDTETTGLPPKGAKYDTDFNQFPFVVQLAWHFKGELKDRIIKPDGYEIPKEASDIHGITTEMALEKGLPFNEVISEFIDDAIMSETVVAHNIYFDTSILKANVNRYANTDNFPNIELLNIGLDKSKRIDTMMKTIKFVGAKMPGSNRLKFPKLEELYMKLFGGTFNAHNAVDDVMATKRCYEELVRIGVVW